MSGDIAPPRELASDALRRILASGITTPAADAAAGRAILEARAGRLAKPLALFDEAAAEDEIDILVFLVGDEQLAIPVSAIVAIVRAGSITPLPRATQPVYGVTAWRGRPLTVLTLNGDRGANDADGRLIVLGDGRRALVALRSDTADDTRLVHKSLLTPSAGGLRSAYALGATPDGVLVLDPGLLIHAARREL
jgi:chemotaxis signal transduction protein